MYRLMLALIVGLLALVGCATPDYSHARAAKICVDGDYVRMPDEYCPIGDNINGRPFSWSYHEYNDGDAPIVVPYVGYHVERSYYAPVRPIHVTTLNIDAGSFPASPPVGKSGTAAVVAAKGTVSKVVSTATTKSSTVARGGLGSSTRSANAGGGYQPKKTLPPPPSGQRAMAKAKR